MRALPLRMGMSLRLGPWLGLGLGPGLSLRPGLRPSLSLSLARLTLTLWPIRAGPRAPGAGMQRA